MTLTFTLTARLWYPRGVSQPAPSAPSAPTEGEPRLRRIQEVAAEIGLTARSIRYYEELGLLAPAARSEGAYRLFDPDDIERLRFIKGLRDDAGFSLAEIGQLLEDEAMRTRNRDRFRTTDDAVEQRAIIGDTLLRVERQIETLRDKMARLAGMIEEAEGRRDHLRLHIAELDAGREPAAHVHTRSGSRPVSATSDDAGQ